jgi:hypothetical protein
MKCKCQNYNSVPATVQEFRERATHTAEIEKFLASEVVNSEKWTELLVCRECGAHWCKEYLPERYEPPCLYQIPAIAPEKWMREFIRLSTEIYQKYEDQAFLDVIGPETGQENCAHEACVKKRVSGSVMCRLHHFEMIRKRPPSVEA